MRVVAVHAYYRTPGGEDQSFHHDLNLLKELGAEVEVLTIRNSDLELSDIMRGRLFNNRPFVSQVSKALDGADLLWANNLWPAASPAVLASAVAIGVPVLQCVRNYRLVCAAGNLRRNGAPCRLCIERKSRAPGIRHKCYEDSYLGSAAVTWASSSYRRILEKSLSPWVLCPTSREVAQELVAGGLPSDHLRVRRNFMSTTPVARLTPGQGVAYVGRLSQEKGITFLLDLWASRSALPTLSIYGDGPMRAEAEVAANRDPTRIQYLGPVAPEAVLDAMSRHALTVVPSDWDEPFGRSAMESLAVGTPVITSDRGALPDVVGDTGRVIALDRIDEWAESVLDLTSRERQAEERRRARDRFESRFTVAAAQRQLQPILESLGLPT